MFFFFFFLGLSGCKKMICHNFFIQYFQSTSLYLSILRDRLTCWDPFKFRTGTYVGYIYPNPFIYSPPATKELCSRYFWQVIIGPTPYLCSYSHFYLQQPKTLNLYLYPLPKMQPCTHKNKQWPSLSSMAEAILSRQPGLIFN